MWRTLADYRLMLSLQLGRVLLLSLYGGANIPIFLSYAVPVQIALLASLLGYPISRWEIAWMFVALILFNRTLLPIPVPQDNYYTFTSSFNAMLDFYAGWGSRINTTTLARFGELCAYLAIANGIRFGLVRRRPAAS